MQKRLTFESFNCSSDHPMWSEGKNDIADLGAPEIFETFILVQPHPKLSRERRRQAKRRAAAIRSPGSFAFQGFGIYYF